MAATLTNLELEWRIRQRCDWESGEGASVTDIHPPSMIRAVSSRDLTPGGWLSLAAATRPLANLAVWTTCTALAVAAGTLVASTVLGDVEAPRRRNVAEAPHLLILVQVLAEAIFYGQNNLYASSTPRMCPASAQGRLASLAYLNERVLHTSGEVLAGTRDMQAQKLDTILEHPHPESELSQAEERPLWVLDKRSAVTEVPDLFQTLLRRLQQVLRDVLGRHQLLRS
mmetsp:Transcript_53850/g.125600  ORF Transcript_53850/g.125600 Transcript_53850/m.125600 type:complete len:227 (+) Transcript_53850:435-1115(+)